MKKFFSLVFKNILFLETIFLLAFIPLFPKLPVLNVNHTWVYVRIEDFVILGVLFTWIILFFRKQVSLKTPLTLPILMFWLVGAVATFHGIIILFATLANVFPNVAFLSLIRHIEYLSLFFVGYWGIKDKKFIPVVSATLILTLLGVIAYGFGQRYLGFSAFLTMNEEFAKGIPIQLSQLSRIPSTFAGHYDLAAYLVLIIPILASLFFEIKNWLIKFVLVVSGALGVVLLIMTVSRVSFAALFIALFVVLFFKKRKLIFVVVPILIIATVVVLISKPTLLNRYQGTVSETNVLVDAKTGNSLGNVEFVPGSSFKDKIILQSPAQSSQQLIEAVSAPSSSLSGIILPAKLIPEQVVLVRPVNLTGEELPQGTGYINLSLSPVVRRVDSFFYQLPPNVHSTVSAQFLVIPGRYVIKRASAYDLSFTTRFQGEWPRAIEAFERNILIGSGYGSVSLAVDNNYFRILAETGLLGFVAFFALFLSFAIYIKKVFPDIEDGMSKSFIIGLGSGIIGLSFNAVLIDVFESSKIAYLLWLLVGISFGTLVFSQKVKFSLFEELKKAATSTYAIVTYLFLFSVALFSSTLNNFFVGDDFTWLRWGSAGSFDIVKYFTQADGFFFRPATKLYFYLMYYSFWMNQVVYHAVSILLHFAVAVVFFLLAKRIFKGTLLASLSAFLFLLMSGYSEMIFWISSTGHLFNALLGLLGVLFFIIWTEKKKLYYYIFSLIFFAFSLFFHELGVVLPLLILAYQLKNGSFATVKNTIKSKAYLFLFSPLLFYFPLRFLANSHWQGGDYSYSLIKLPLNALGNAFGYIMLTFLGPSSLSIYEKLRETSKGNIILIGVIVLLVVVLAFAFKYIFKKLSGEEKGILYFGGSFFLISLLPFLGLGNITSRYSYLAALGLIIIFVFGVKKLYFYLLTNGKEIALLTTSLFVIIYSLFHIIQLQQSSFDWAGAGVKSNQFFVSIDALYSDYWSKEPIELHFVNVPIKYGQAWVFPVGLNDAVWFAFKNPNARVFLDNNVNTILTTADNPLNKKVFIFSDDGSVKEIPIKTQ